MKSIKQILDEKKTGDTSPPDPSPALGEGERKRRFISREYQDYGYRLSRELADPKHKSLYIKMAKEMDRSILEQAKRFVIDSNADNKGALFMWKIREIKKVTK